VSIERRRFPPPWKAEETNACLIVKDDNGQALAYVYFEDEPGRVKSPGLSSRARLPSPLIHSSPKPVEAPHQFGRDELRGLLRVERSASNGDADNGAG
jgi:hypothetical protein